MISVTFDRKRRLSVFRLVVPQPLAIRVIRLRLSQISICAHLSVAVIGVEWALRCVNRDVIEINTEAVSLGISIREQPSLKHLVRRPANSRNHIRRGEGRLLHLREEVFWITIELYDANFDERVVSLGPDFGQIKRIVLVCLCLLLCHYLDEELPTRKIPASDCLEQVSAMALPMFCYNRSGSFVRQVFNTLLRAKVELYPGALVLTIDHREGVTSEKMHVPEGSR